MLMQEQVLLMVHYRVCYGSQYYVVDVMQPHPTGLRKLLFTVDHDISVAIPQTVNCKQCCFKGGSVSYVAIAGQRTRLLLLSHFSQYLRFTASSTASSLFTLPFPTSNRVFLSFFLPFGDQVNIRLGHLLIYHE
jgi:hypothetical protein